MIASGRIVSGLAAPPREPRPAAHVPVAVASLPAGNGGMFPEPNGGAAASVAVSWLDWQLRGDRQSADGSWVKTAGCAGTASGRWQRKQFPATASGIAPAAVTAPFAPPAP